GRSMSITSFTASLARSCSCCSGSTPWGGMRIRPSMCESCAALTWTYSSMASLLAVQGRRVPNEETVMSPSITAGTARLHVPPHPPQLNRPARPAAQTKEPPAAAAKPTRWRHWVMASLGLIVLGITTAGVAYYALSREDVEADKLVLQGNI